MMPNRCAPWLLGLLGLLFSAPEAFANPCAIPLAATVGLPPGARPVPVEAGIFTIDILSISDAEQTFHIDAFTKTSWQDSRLADFAGCRVAPREIWNPHLELINSSELQTRLLPMAHIKEGGRVELVQRFVGKVTSPHTLEAFPFDSRSLGLGVSPRSHSPEEVELSIAPHLTGRAGEFSIADWDIGDYRAWVDSWVIPAIGQKRSRINYELPAQRLRGYWITKVMFPLALIIAMSWAVFWIDLKQLSTAIRLGATSMLTLIAYRFMVSEQLPPVPYLTRMDYFILGCTMLVFGTLIESGLTSIMANRGSVSMARWLARACRVLFPAGFIAIYLLSFELV